MMEHMNLCHVLITMLTAEKQSVRAQGPLVIF